MILSRSPSVLSKLRWIVSALGSYVITHWAGTGFSISANSMRKGVVIGKWYFKRAISLYVWVTPRIASVDN